MTRSEVRPVADGLQRGCNKITVPQPSCDQLTTGTEDSWQNSRQSMQAPMGQRVGHTLRDACITWCVVPAQRLVGRRAPTRSPVLSGPRPLARAVHRRALFEGFAGLPSERRARLVLRSLYAGHSVVGSNES